ncbi:MAG: DUF1330 domain-containing protein [Micromonosporaceae bacterium]|nr:DUF1330 domain-containing protein [Micromonosporaceae bacterium]
MSSAAGSDPQPVRGYAVAHLRNVRMGPDLVTYLERIDATLEPYQGRFIVHGGKPQAVEGRWSGSLIVVEFPTRENAAAWYASAAYQEILPLRLRHAEGWVVLVDGVPDGHVATDALRS